MKTADANQIYVMEFCSSICAHSAPMIVECSPAHGTAENECFELVGRKVQELGGSQVFGWAVWEKPGVFIEAEFHSVWQQPNGMYLDINPRNPIFNIKTNIVRSGQENKIQRKTNRQYSQSLVNDNDVIRFLYLSAKRFQILNRGKRAYEHGEVSLPNKEIKEYQRAMKELIKLQNIINNRYSTVTA
ncbi:hypothetical protein [Pseudomonas sp. OIL-1]|uniref:hypothetical protein n=1 Tax=Pseudomonas sp. OIL-1 TaxID=2706126 RepID=UPI0013A7868C|nr:hypothetical protein [Pseudomonas sp. OIL-1]QIB50364.1 hypothetical protein G3M63_04315 [Pseudomonas sp. OIL-1]